MWGGDDVHFGFRNVVDAVVRSGEIQVVGVYVFCKECDVERGCFALMQEQGGACKGRFATVGLADIEVEHGVGVVALVVDGYPHFLTCAYNLAADAFELRDFGFDDRVEYEAVGNVVGSNLDFKIGLLASALDPGAVV